MSDLERYSPAIALWFSCLGLMSLDFGAVVLRGGSPITPEIYGPSVYAFPALGWVALQAAFSALGAASFFLPLMYRAIGFIIAGLALGVLFGAFAVMAGQAPSGSVLESGSKFLSVPLCFMSALIGAGHFYVRK